jgi:hypothetical protein
MIDRQQASEALAGIDDIVGRLRQSRIYNLASLMLILWGVLVFAGYLVNYLTRYGGYGWVAVYVVGIAGCVLISVFNRKRTGIRTLDVRMLVAFVLFIVFGIFVSVWLGHFTPRQLGAFWPIYFMMVYTITGLWFGYAFVAIGLGITALTLIGYFFLGSAFDLWMAFVDGGGLVLGGLWMRRV